VVSWVWRLCIWWIWFSLIHLPFMVVVVVSVVVVVVVVSVVVVVGS